MNRALVVLAPCFAMLSFACGGASETSTVPTSGPTADASTSLPASSAAPDTKPEGPKAADAKSPFKFLGYKGPKTATAIDTPAAWVLVPLDGKNGWDALKIVVEDRLRSEGDAVVVGASGEEWHVPAALAWPAKPAAGLKAGDPVIASPLTYAVYGRVERVDASTGKVKVAYAFSGDVSSEEFDANHVLRLEDKLAFGQPVVFDGKYGRDVGTLVTSDGKDAAVLVGTGTLAIVPAATTKPAKTALRKKGDKAWSPALGDGTITEVIRGGVQYRLKTEHREDVVNFDAIADSGS